jgi:hypothetical protein
MVVVRDITGPCETFIRYLGGRLLAWMIVERFANSREPRLRLWKLRPAIAQVVEMNVFWKVRARGPT